MLFWWLPCRAFGVHCSAFGAKLVGTSVVKLLFFRTVSVLFLGSSFWQYKSGQGITQQ